jgi:hypothetical protein
MILRALILLPPFIATVAVLAIGCGFLMGIGQ